MSEPEYQRRRRERADRIHGAQKSEDQKAAEQADVEKIVSAITAAVDELTREDANDRLKSSWERNWRKAEVFGLWFAGIVGLVAIGISNHDATEQRNVMQDQLATMAAQQRPWISVTDQKLNGAFELRVGKPSMIGFSIHLKNVGQAVAIGIEPSAELVILGRKVRPEDSDKIFRAQDRNCSTPNSNLSATSGYSGDLMFPGEDVEINYYAQNDEGPLLNKFYKIGGRPFARVMIVGCITYQFYLSPEVHSTRFAYALQWLNHPLEGPDLAQLQSLRGMQYVDVPVGNQISPQSSVLSKYIEANGYAD